MVRGQNSPWVAPSWELSKNCLGQMRDSTSEDPPASKNLLFGDSHMDLFGESKPCWGFSGNLFGGLMSSGASAALRWPRLVGVQGCAGWSPPGLVLALSFMALLFHLEISAAWLDTRLGGGGKEGSDREDL